MIVLAIHDGHDAAACLLQDGKLVLYSAEERRRNVKNSPGVPSKSIQALFQRSGINSKDVDLVAISCRIRTRVPTHTVGAYYYNPLTHFFRFAKGETTTAMGQWLLSRLRKRKDLIACLAEYGLDTKPMVTYDHHLTHAACAYYHRPWSGDAVVLTLDGAGDGLCATVSVGKGDQIQVLARTPKFHSMPAYMYSAITAHLGLKPFEHEYKVMGMAPYGQAEPVAPILRGLFEVNGLRFRNRTGKIGDGIMKLYRDRLDGQRFDNVSAACQLVFEEMMVDWVHNAVRATGIKKVVGAGGEFLNVKANKLIREMPEVEAFYAYPASDDGGTPVGTAILGYLDLCRQRGETPALNLPRDMYLGLEFSEAEMEAAAAASGLPYEKMPEPAKRIAAMLADGKIIGRFNGREECGPRALGNRSILADPRDLKQIRKLNFAIKYRDFWMPFATSMLEEDARKYIKNLNGWPFYMIDAFDTYPPAEAAFIAGMHPFDMTVRPQIVNELNPSYRDIIQEFKNITGIGAVLNTSFNLHGFPIVGTPEVAIDTLKKSDLDAVALGSILVSKVRK